MTGYNRQTVAFKVAAIVKTIIALLIVAHAKLNSFVFYKKAGLCSIIGYYCFLELSFKIKNSFLA